MSGSSQHSLQALSEEVLDIVVSALELNDVRNLRLSSRTLAAKAVQGYYKGHFTHKTIKIRTESLLEFKRMTRNAGLGCLLQHLYIEGVVDDLRKWSLQDHGRNVLSQPEPEAMEHIALLREALINVRAARGAHALRSITIQVADLRIEKPDNTYLDDFIIAQNRWRPIWLRAATTFDLVVSALAGSALQVEQLQVFQDFDKMRCSLAGNALDEVMSRGENANAFRELKKLSLCLSDPEAPGSFDGVRKLLLSAPLLEDLDLHQFSIGPQNLPLTRFTPRDRILGIPPAWEVPQDAEENLLRVFERASTLETLPRLRVLRLSGIYTTGSVLHRFVQRTMARSISLLHIRLTEGSFQPFFDYCSASTSAIDSIEFDEMYDAVGQVIFEDPLAYALKRGGGRAVRTPIKYHVFAPQGTLQPSPQSVKREYKRRHLFGPL